MISLAILASLVLIVAVLVVVDLKWVVLVRASKNRWLLRLGMWTALLVVLPIPFAYIGRVVLLNYCSRLELGQTEQSVRELYAGYEYPLLRMADVTEGSQSTRLLMVYTVPGQWNFKHWILLLSFSNERLVAIRVRTMDAVNERPRAAPNDRVE